MNDLTGKRVRVDRPLWEFATATVLKHNVEDHVCQLLLETGSLAGRTLFCFDHQLVPVEAKGGDAPVRRVNPHP